MDHEKRSGLSTQPYCLCISINSEDIRIKLDFYYMKTCVSFVKANTVINEINIIFHMKQQSLGRNFISPSDLMKFSCGWMKASLIPTVFCSRESTNYLMIHQVSILV